MTSSASPGDPHPTESDVSEAVQRGRDESWLRHWHKAITTNPPPPEVCERILAELDRLRVQRDAVLAELDTWRSGNHDLAGSHLALMKIAGALGVTS